MQALLALVLCEEREPLPEACELLNRKLSAAVALAKKHLDRRFVLRRLECEISEESREDRGVAWSKGWILRVHAVWLKERTHDGGAPQRPVRDASKHLGPNRLGVVVKQGVGGA